MKNNGLFLRVLWIVSGVLLIAAGVLSMWNPQAVARFFTVLFGVVLLLSGLLDIAAFLKCRHAVVGGRLDIDRWTPHRADGGLSAVQPVAGRPRNSGDLFACGSCFPEYPPSSVPWISNSFGVRGWGWFLLLGILQMALGVLLFIQPVVATFAVGILIGSVLVFSGVWPRSSPACFPDAFCPDTHMKKHVQMGCNR